ncbi:tRNA methyltransferase ppm2 [Lithohypha guttulata]|nr:tRNA methyltransferase ppm2 [Lithohypha guttulata]
MTSLTNGVPPGMVVDDEIQIEKNAGLVMATNNSSIVSKRSVEKLYLPEPHFFRCFVKKPIRRAPTINRGYWLRMRAIDWVVKQFLEKPSQQGKVVINFGCGYDPLPFQWLARDPTLCANTKFIDVDYELLMETKRNIIQDTAKIKDLLHPLNADASGKDRSILFDSEEYAAVGCDLRNLPRLERLLRNVVDIENCLVLCVAEVSITYMQTEAADALIAWSSGLSSDVTFCLLEQCSPDQMDNPFTMTMLKHFAKLGTPLRSVLEYPGQHTQTQRFKAAGFTQIDYNNLWELWSDPRFLSPSQRVALDQVEPFDEWEEFALFASHYCLVVAHNQEDSFLVERPRSRRDSTISLSSDISARTSSPPRLDKEWFGLHYNKEPGDMCQRHHGSAYMIPDQDAIGVHGGVGTRSRLATTAVVRPITNKDGPPVVLPLEIGARCCHTITPLDSGQNLLVGGRGSPTSVYKDCWLQTGQVWERVHDLPEPRYRHRVVPVVLPDNSSGAICLGGKMDPCIVASDILLWEPTKGWRVLRVKGPDPVPRFGALFLRLGYNHGLLSGGMRQDGVICQGLFRWRLRIRNNEIVYIDFRTSKALDASAGTWPYFARFGPSYSIQRDEVLMIGGIAKSGCIPKPYEIMSMIGCFSNYKDAESELPLRVVCVNPPRDPNCPRPFLVGHSTHRTRSGLSITLGGGATCFSFGNYFNTGIWILYDREAGLPTDWTTVLSIAASMPTTKEKPAATIMANQAVFENVQQTEIQSSEQFANVVRYNEPRLLSNLDFGPCVQKWSPSYLQDAISSERTVVVHDACKSRMNFQRKDFTYKNMSWSQFLTRLADEDSHLYLRSLAAANPSSMPADLWTDFPEIAADFVVPTPLADVKADIHSSPLRISNDINMWLHYDVMANVLFQIHGLKKLILFPPQDLLRLQFPPGSTTSQLELFNSTQRGKEYDFFAPQNTSPIVAILKPGDALFIPPLWAHTGVSLPDPHLPHSKVNMTGPLPSHLSDGTHGSQGDDSTSAASNGEQPVTEPAFAGILNIAVNMFFRNLPQSSYAAGRDVYGNRDLACYEDGRRMAEKLVSKFKNSHQQGSPSERLTGASLDWIPKDIRKIYLLRIAREIEEQAEAL